MTDLDDIAFWVCGGFTLIKLDDCCFDEGGKLSLDLVESCISRLSMGSVHFLPSAINETYINQSPLYSQHPSRDSFPIINIDLGFGRLGLNLPSGRGRRLSILPCLFLIMLLLPLLIVRRIRQEDT